MNNAQQFEQQFRTRPDLTARAPGRLEILGNHTDYNQGWVLSCAIDCNTEISFRKIEGSTCRVCSPVMNDGIREFDLSDLTEELPDKDWLKYIRGLVIEFKNGGHPVGPFEALITSNVPLSAGMSSSAALEMACVTGLSHLFGIELTLEQKARLGQACEHHAIGAKTGLMDQLTSLAGKKGQLVVSEYRNLTIEHTPLPSEYVFVVVDSGVRHDLSQEYNDRRAQCELAVAQLQQHDGKIKSLRDVSHEFLVAHESHLDPTPFRRALHVVGENERVTQAIALLKQNQVAEFGQLLFDSHASSQNNFENSCPELDTIIELARDSKECLGARLSGGGFGGVSIHLLRADEAENYRQAIADQIESRAGTRPRTLVCQSGDGAAVVGA